MIKFYNHQNCDIIGGPQKHEIKNPRFKDFYFELEPKKKSWRTSKLDSN